MSRTGRPLALLGALALLVSAFLPWSGGGRTAIDLGLVSFGRQLEQPTVGLVLVVLAAVPSIAALIDDHGWPRGASALAAGALVVTWLARGPDGTLTSGVSAAVIAVVVLLISSAVARPAAATTSRYPGTHVDAENRTDTPRPPRDPELDVADPRPSAGEVGARVVPFTPRPQIEAWGPTRATCFEAVVRGLAGTVVDTDRLEPTSQHAVRLRERDDASTLFALVEQVAGLARAGRVPIDADLFDTEDGAMAGYLALAEVPGLPASALSDPEETEVEAGPTWQARVTLT